MPRSLRVAIGQMAGLLKQDDANLETACRLATEAATRGARLILLPEAALTGLSLEDRRMQSTLPVSWDKFIPLLDIAQQRDITICAGFVSQFGGRFNVAHAIILPSGEVRFQRKAVRANGEPDFLGLWPDPRRTVFEVDGIRVAVVIGGEMESERIVSATKSVLPQLVLHPTARPLPAHQVRHEDPCPDETEACEQEPLGPAVQRAHAFADGPIPQVTANPIGFDGVTWWPGGSYAIDADGEIKLHLPGTDVAPRMKPSVGVTGLRVPDL